MRLLDLFCGAGGASMGYHRAGFEVVGVDLVNQPHYPFEFYQEDALAWLNGGSAAEFDAIHASPPCQGYSPLAQDPDVRLAPRLIAATRTLLTRSGLPYVIENITTATPEMLTPVRYCGSSFGLNVQRHRWFEANWDLVAPPCDHSWQTPRFPSLYMPNQRAGRLSRVVGVHGNLNYPGELKVRREAMGIDWMTNAELVEAIPPAYTEHIGKQLISSLNRDTDMIGLDRGGRI